MTRDGPIPNWLGGLTAPLYGAGVSWRNRRFDQGRGVNKVPVPVISIGNLSVGGTGKTPIVMHLVRELLHAGVRPAIAMRGYTKGEADGENADEAQLYRDAFDDEIPVIAQPDRTAGIHALLETGTTPDCILLDDGFQHRKLARDLDIIVIDATRSPFRDRLLPAGWLREPVSSLDRADFAIITHAESAYPDQIEAIRDGLRRLPVAVSRHAWVGLSVRQGDRETCTDTGWLRDKRVVSACAIGNPDVFVRTVRARSAQVLGEIIRPDHDPYAEPAIREINEAAAHADAIVVTEKDWSKLKHHAFDRPVARPILRLSFDVGRERLTSAVLNAILEATG